MKKRGLSGIEEHLIAEERSSVAVPEGKNPRPAPRHAFRAFARTTCSSALLLVTLIPLAVLILVLNLDGVALLLIVVAIPWSMSRFLDKAWDRASIPTSSTASHG